MATPTTNTIAVADFDPAIIDNNLIEAMLWASKWGGDLGSGVTLDYSFPLAGASFVEDYEGGEPDFYFALNQNEKAAVRQAILEASESANVIFTEVADNSSVVGELRFTGMDTSEEDFAHAYFPHASAEGGDTWFSDEWNPD